MSSLYNVTVTGVKRLQNSYDGNPKWRLTLQDSSGQEYIRTTLKDSMVAYKVTHNMEGDVIDAICDGRGALTHIITEWDKEYTS